MTKLGQVIKKAIGGKAKNIKNAAYGVAKYIPAGVANIAKTGKAVGSILKPKSKLSKAVKKASKTTGDMIPNASGKVGPVDWSKWGGK